MSRPASARESERPSPAHRLAAFARAWPLLVLALLAWPFEGAPLAVDPWPHLAGAGYVALAAAPPALALLLERRSVAVRGLPWLVLAVAWALGRTLLGHLDDTFAARVALVLLAAAPALVATGARMEERERRLLVPALTALSLLLTLRALWGATREPPDWAGVLGNSGPLSQAALPGALCGAFLAARGPSAARRALGAAAVVAFALHAGLAPVLAGAAVFAAAAGLGALLWRGVSARERGTLALAALVVLALPTWRLASRASTGSATAPTAADGTTSPSAPSETSAITTEERAFAGDLGGLTVRTRLWTRVHALLALHPLGVGPGQLQATFPPVRDPRERVLSDAAAGGATEVEHLHSDPLQALAELGPLGGGAWILFLVTAALTCVRALRDGEPARAATALALTGLLANGLAHTPLTVQPVSAAIGFLLCGTVLAKSNERRDALPLYAAFATRTALVARASSLAALVALPFALPLLAHGRALASYIDAARRIDERLTALDGAAPDPSDPVLRAAALDARAALERALHASPDSVPALVLTARAAAPPGRIAAWEAVLARRPHHWEALFRASSALTAAGDERRAADLANRARELAPER